ncbi:MAG: DUF2911 domain-containing protein [bacterium]
MSSRSLARLIACSSVVAIAAPVGAQNATAGFVVTLGNDTTSVEQFTRTSSSLTGDVVTRQGGTAIAHYVVMLNASGAPTKLDITYQKFGGGVPANGVKSVSATYGPDSTIIVIMRDTAITRRFAVKDPYPMVGGLAPSLGLFELSLSRIRATKMDTLSIAALAPGAAAAPRLMTGVKFYGADSARIWTQGYVQYARVDATGRLLGLSGRETTQKIETRRLPALDVQKLAAGFAAGEAQGKAMTTVASSAKDSVKATVGSAQISIVYFRPTARGRDVFTNGVLGDTLWRTGANDATMFTTSSDLVVAGKTVPAGSYTLWTSVPRDNSHYELVINKQTKQWGTVYDQAQDLVRVPLSVGKRSSPMEAFQISVEPSANGGALKLSWAGTDLSVPITSK